MGLIRLGLDDKYVPPFQISAQKADYVSEAWVRAMQAFVDATHLECRVRSHPAGDSAAAAAAPQCATACLSAPPPPGCRPVISRKRQPTR
jgi:hypothetical protein